MSSIIVMIQRQLHFSDIPENYDIGAKTQTSVFSIEIFSTDKNFGLNFLFIKSNT